MILPPTAKLPCSWIVSGSNLLLFVSCAPAKEKGKIAIKKPAAKVFRHFQFIHSPFRASSARMFSASSRVLHAR